MLATICCGRTFTSSPDKWMPPLPPMRQPIHEGSLRCAHPWTCHSTCNLMLPCAGSTRSILTMDRLEAQLLASYLPTLSSIPGSLGMSRRSSNCQSWARISCTIITRNTAIHRRRARRSSALFSERFRAVIEEKCRGGVPAITTGDQSHGLGRRPDCVRAAWYFAEHVKSFESWAAPKYQTHRY